MGAALTQALTITDRRFEAIFVPPPWVPTPQNLRFGDALGVLDGLVEDLVAKRRADGTRADDLLGMLMEARFEGSDEGLSDKQLRDEVMMPTPPPQ